MKGLVFCEFLDMVESSFSADMVDTLIDNTQPKSGGAYTSVGNYEFEELENMLIELAKQSNTAPDDLLKAFGAHLAKVFAQKYAAFFIEAGGPIALLREVDRHVHVEVKKLYPDAELPSFSYEDADENTPFKLHYRSQRNLYMLAYGLIDACCHYYGEPHHIEYKAWKEGDDTCCTFEISPIQKAA